jgi:predicted  nucleic acid-binding Zn-ribbon protein
MEGQLTAKVEVLEHQLAEKQRLLESSGAELGELRSQIYVLTERMGEVEGAKFRAEAQLHEERNRASEARAQSELNHPVTRRELKGEAHALDDLLKERDELLKARDKLIQELMVELKEKKSQLAKHEIEVWQGIERRGVWKHRLSKFGIRLKD